MTRFDETRRFARIADGAAVRWHCSTTRYLWHASADDRVAVCSSAVTVDPLRDPFPHTYDRSNDTMTCDRCAGLVRHVRPS